MNSLTDNMAEMDPRYNMSEDYDYEMDSSMVAQMHIHFAMIYVVLPIGQICNIITFVFLAKSRNFRFGPNLYLTSQLFIDIVNIMLVFYQAIEQRFGLQLRTIHFFCILFINITFIVNFIVSWLSFLYPAFWFKLVRVKPAFRRYSGDGRDSPYPSCNCPHLGILFGVSCFAVVCYFHLWWMMGGCQFIDAWQNFIFMWRYIDIYVNSILPHCLALLISIPLAIKFHLLQKRSATTSVALGNGQSTTSRHVPEDRRQLEPVVFVVPLITSLCSLPYHLMTCVNYSSEVLPPAFSFYFERLVQLSHIIKPFLVVLFSRKFRARLCACSKSCATGNASLPVPNGDGSRPTAL